MTSVISLTTLRCTCLSSKRSNLGSPIFLYRPFAGFFLGFFFGDFFLLALGLGRAGSPHRAWRTVNSPGFLRAALFLIVVFFFLWFRLGLGSRGRALLGWSASAQEFAQPPTGRSGLLNGALALDRVYFFVFLVDLGIALALGARLIPSGKRSSGCFRRGLVAVERVKSLGHEPLWSKLQNNAEEIFLEKRSIRKIHRMRNEKSRPRGEGTLHHLLEPCQQ